MKAQQRILQKYSNQGGDTSNNAPQNNQSDGGFGSPFAPGNLGTAPSQLGATSPNPSQKSNGVQGQQQPTQQFFAPSHQPAHSTPEPEDPYLDER